LGGRGPAVGRRRTSARARHARPRDPTSDGAGRHLALAGRAVGRSRTIAGRRPGGGARRPVTARPARVVFVAGTGTAVGRAWVAAELRGGLPPAGRRVTARNPAQAFGPWDTSTEPDGLAAATGESPHDVCPPHRWYARALAPPMAAAALDAPAFTVRDLVAELRWPEQIDVGLVEGAGGPRSPIAADGDNVSLAGAIAPDLVLLVGEAGLGAINAVRMSVDTFGPAPVTVVLNRYDERDAVHRANRDWLVAQNRFRVGRGAGAAGVPGGSLAVRPPFRRLSARVGQTSEVPADPGGAGAPTPAARVTALTLVLVSAAATTTAVVHRFASIGRAGLLALAFVALAFAVGVGRWRRALGMRTVLVLTVGLLAVAVAYWPPDSTDLWSYAAYGRIMSHYGASPYRHVPVEYSNDRAVRRVGPVWQNTSSVYGPLWNGISAGVVALANTDAHSTRTLFQGLAALSVFLAALLVARRTRAPAAVALIGLNPLVIYDIVNGGHNDALVGLAILVGVLLATRERFVLAAVALALGALVKLVALLALAALIVWVWRRRGSRPALASGAAAGGVVALGYAVSGGLDALKPLQDARLQMSRNSIWLLTSSDGRARLFGLDRALLSPDFLRPVATISMITVLLLAAVLVASRLRDRTPTLVVGSALVAYLLASM